MVAEAGFPLGLPLQPASAAGTWEHGLMVVMVT